MHDRQVKGAAGVSYLQPLLPFNALVMKRKIQLLVLAFILFTIIVVNIRATLDNYYGFYFPKEKNRAARAPLYRALSFVESNRVYRLFNTYSGLETGYGFFAPNVASEFVVSFTLYDGHHQVLDSCISVDFHNKESFMRMISAYSMFFEYKEGDTLNPEYQKCIIFLKGLSYQMLLQTKRATSVKTNLYLYHYPMLEQLRERKMNSPVYFLYTSKTYQLNDYANWN